MLSKETFEINSTEHRKAQRISKIRNLAKGNKNPAEKAAAEKKAGGPKLVGETKEIKEVWGAVAKVAMGAAKGAVKQKAKQVVKQKAANVVAGAIPQPNRDQQNEGVGRAAIGAVLGSPLGPLGSAAGAAIGASMGKKKVTSGGKKVKKKATNFFKAEPKVTSSEGVVAFVKKGLDRDKKAKKEKDIKNRKAVPYAALAAEHQPEGELVDETYFDTNRRGISTKGGFSKQYNKPGKLSRASLNHERKSKDPELRMSKKELRKSMEDDANYEKKMGRSKPTPSNLKTALKKQSASEDWQPEITHSKMGDATKKAAEKKKKEAQKGLPPHLQGDWLAKARKAFKENYRVLARDKGDKGRPAQFSYKDEKDANKFADSIKSKGGKATVAKEEVVTERLGGAGTLVRQGVKVGGKKGGQAVKAGTTAATTAGKQAASSAAQGNKSKLVGSGRFEKAGAAVGGAVGGVAGAAIPDGPLMVAGEIAGGIAGSKVGGKIGRQLDKKFSKESTYDEPNLAKRKANNEKARKFLKKDAKDSGYTDIALKASMSKGAGVSESKATAKLAAKVLKDKEPCNECGSVAHVTGQCPKKDHDIGEGVMDIVNRYKKKKEEKKPQKAQDAGARARRVLKRREYQSKVSAIVPAELEDHKVWDRIKKIW